MQKGKGAEVPKGRSSEMVEVHQCKSAKPKKRRQCSYKGGSAKGQSGKDANGEKGGRAEEQGSKGNGKCTSARWLKCTCAKGRRCRKTTVQRGNEAQMWKKRKVHMSDKEEGLKCNRA